MSPGLARQSSAVCDAFAEQVRPHRQLTGEPSCSLARLFAGGAFVLRSRAACSSSPKLSDGPSMRTSASLSVPLVSSACRLAVGAGMLDDGGQLPVSRASWIASGAL